MPTLSKDFRMQRGKWLVGEIKAAIRDRSPLDDKLELVRSLYWMDKDAGAVPWEGASDVHLPVLYEKIVEGTLSNGFVLPPPAMRFAEVVCVTGYARPH